MRENKRKNDTEFEEVKESMEDQSMSNESWEAE
jgi:hypothetical protein